MKKINSLMLGVLVLFAGFFGSCSKDTSAPGPSINAYLNNQSVDTLQVTINSTVSYKFEISAPGKLKSVQLSTKVGTTTQTDPAITSGFLSDTFHIVSGSVVASANTDITISVTDKNDVTITKTVSIKVTAAAGQINSYPSLNMGGSSSSYGSYLDAETGTVYTSSQLNATVDATIDIIFDASKLWNYDSGTFASGTGTKFATTTITSAQFGLITDDSSFASMSATLSSVTVAAGNVVFFTTTGGKKGLALINSLSSSTGNLNISLVVQK